MAGTVQHPSLREGLTSAPADAACKVPLAADTPASRDIGAENPECTREPQVQGSRAGQDRSPSAPRPGEPCSTALSTMLGKGHQRLGVGAGKGPEPQAPANRSSSQGRHRVALLIWKDGTLGSRTEPHWLPGRRPKDSGHGVGFGDGRRTRWKLLGRPQHKNVSPAARRACPLSRPARSAFYGELATGKRPQKDAPTWAPRPETGHTGLGPAGRWPSPLQPGGEGDTLCVERKAIVVNFFERWSDYV